MPSRPATALPRPPAGPSLSRRGLLLAGAGLALAAACGGESQQELSFLRLFQDGVPTGGDVRLPFSIGDEQGVPLEDPPAELRVRIGPDGGEPGPAFTVARHDRGVPRPYYPIFTTVEAAGVYRVATEVGGRTVESAFTALAPGAGFVPGPGEPMFSVATPTVDDARGVDPICTDNPPCPLHDVSLDAALAEGRPVALLVATPAFCRTAVCGPVVTLLAEQRAAYGGRVALIHAEVYTRASLESPPTDAVVASRLRFEPCLFLVDGTGTIRRRLDNIFDRTEVEDGLAAIA
jgi:hypothetical protein